MTVDTNTLGRAWDNTGEEEISLKQIYAHLFNYFGFCQYIELDIQDSNNFVGSDSVHKGFLNNEKIQNSVDEVDLESSETKNYGITVSDSVERAFKGCGGFDGIITKAMNLDMGDATKLFPKGDFHKALIKFEPADLYIAFIALLRNDSFDSFLNRYFIARKKKVDETLEMLSRSLNWRIRSHPVDKWVFGGDAEVYFSGKNPDFIEAFKINQAYLRGKDKLGRPVVIIHVKDHIGKNSTEKDFEKFICVIIEWIRLELKPLQYNIDRGCILFDMTGFSLRNADLSAVRFLASALESNYPEFLGAIWVHNAPWVFNAVWKVIRGWLDPVVASKVHFTKNCKDLEAFIDRKFIPKDLGGNDAFVMKYENPTHSDSDEKPKDDNYAILSEQRSFLILSYLQATINWLESKTISESDKFLEARIKIGIQLANNYIGIDPYLRKRGIFERIGEMGKLGY
ncbi:uncharacterized protein PRCAT00005017001 [Priceomyces carsonii]|uniref:uncharacterized protein n=1 Tax=Priceomyces carsonii TaxID=28549 RepID=UPI002ED8C4FD|nr:unnamed protein product [Priceomyces carsonii]